MAWGYLHKSSGRQMRWLPAPSERLVGATGSGRGSVVLFVLFLCLAIAVLIQTLCAVVVCGERALDEEADGRLQLAARDGGLAALRRGALDTWESKPWRVLETEPVGVSGGVAEIEDGAGWILEAGVRLDPPLSGVTTSAWLERGRDGVDLPVAAMVASSVDVSSERIAPWMLADGDGSAGGPGGGECGATGYVVDRPEQELIGPGCALMGLSQPWRLDEGWRALDTSSACLGKRGAILGGEEGATVELPPDLDGSIAECPFMVIALGGVDLDVRNRGDLYGVLVVDQGSVLLEGTTLHGAVFAGGCVDFGYSGCLVSCRPILRWATDRSLDRVRLAPGTRWEGTE